MLHELTSLNAIIEEARVEAQLDTATARIAFSVSVEPELWVTGDRQMLTSAVANLLHNAFKFTQPKGHVRLIALVVDKTIRIEVADGCGGLVPGLAGGLFQPLIRSNGDRSRAGGGLSISRGAVEANGGTISARDRPGTGCIFTIELPRS